MPGTVPTEQIYQIADTNSDANQEDESTQHEEESQWAIHHKRAGDYRGGALHITPHAGKQARGAQFPIGANGNACHSDAVLPRLDNRLQCVCVRIHHIHAQRCFS